MQKSRNITTILLNLAIAAAIIRFFSLWFYPLFDPTEGRYAEIGRKMFETGNWVTPFIGYNVPFWAKPPLSFWLTAISYKIFGASEFAARMPSFIVMAMVLWVVHLSCRSMPAKTNAQNETIIPLLILSTMALFFYLAGGIMTDPTLALGVTLGMLSFWQAVEYKNKLWGYGFFLGSIIALLAKGPIGLILMGMPIFIWVAWENRWKDTWNNLPWVYGIIITTMAVLPWYILAEIRTPGFLKYFIIGEHFERFLVKGWKGDLYGSGRAHPLGTIWLYALLAMLPWSLFFLSAPFSRTIRKTFSISGNAHSSWNRYLWLWALTPLIFFTLAKNILITYVITALPAFALLLTPAISALAKEKHGRFIIVTASLFVPLACIVALAVINLNPYASWIKSEQQITQDYKNQQTTAPLLYIGKHSYSEDFYLQGHDIEISTIADIKPYFTGEFFIVMTPAFYKTLPEDIKKGLAIVSQKNNSVLLHHIP